MSVEGTSAPEAAIVEAEQPVGNPFDGSQQAYESSDEAEAIEQVLQEKKAQELEEPAKKNDEFSSKFAALSRREKQLRERESQLDQKLAMLEERLSKLDTPKEEPKKPELPIELRLKKDPLNVLAELGLSYDKLTQLALNDGKLTPDMQLELMRQEMDQKYSSEFENLKKELVDRDKRLEEEKYNEVVTNFKHDLTNFVNNDDKYELIRANDAVDVVFDVIEQHYNDTGRIMSKDEAADQVEAYLEEEVEKLLKLNKLKSKLGQQKPVNPPPQESKMAPKAPTLSNTHSATVSKPSGGYLTREQSVASAASLLKWND